ncbi:MAG TPA: OsmC family protein [Gemmatimonadaceae bacterium]|nr:OsmC family protein [Gemmatimonadaceae bacterium]
MQQPIVVTQDRGMRFVAHVRSHRVIVDQPRHAGGDDSGPMPLELIGASLGTCIALYAQRFLESRGLPHEGMRVEVEQFGAGNPHRIGELVARIILPAALPPRDLTLLEQVARSCPAHATLTHSPRVGVTIMTPEPAMGGNERARMR